MPYTLTGCVAIITGGSKGIGRAIAMVLATVVTGRDNGNGPGTASAIAAEIAAVGGRAWP